MVKEFGLDATTLRESSGWCRSLLLHYRHNEETHHTTYSAQRAQTRYRLTLEQKEPRYQKMIHNKIAEPFRNEMNPNGTVAPESIL